MIHNIIINFGTFLERFRNFFSFETKAWEIYFRNFAYGPTDTMTLLKTFNLDIIRLKFVYTMKKIFALLAIASMMAVACGKDNNDPKPDNGEYVKPIEIDGDFSDWAKLDSKKVAVAKTLTDDETSYTALKTVMVYADKNSVFIRFSFDKDQMSMDYAPFHIWIDSDNDESTGGYAGNFTESSIDVMLEGTFIDGSEFVSYDPSVYQWIGEPQASGWDWDELLAGGSGLCSGAGNGTEYEIELVRELFPLGQLPDEFRIGFDIQFVDEEDWNTVGLLPNGAPTNDNAGGLAPMLKVVTVK